MLTAAPAGHHHLVPVVSHRIRSCLSLSLGCGFILIYADKTVRVYMFNELPSSRSVLYCPPNALISLQMEDCMFRIILPPCMIAFEPCVLFWTAFLPPLITPSLLFYFNATRNRHPRFHQIWVSIHMGIHHALSPQKNIKSYIIHLH